MLNLKYDFKKIEVGLNLLINNDGYLLYKNINERSITHKLAEYLQNLFPEWNVDCEYNKNIDLLKDLDPRELLLKMANYLEEVFPNQNIRRDDIYSREEISDLVRQLHNPEKLKYIEGLDIYVFLLDIDGEEELQTIYPDIIIHRRGTHENHIVIEAKKTKNRSRKARLYDLAKLAILVSSSNYNYRKGIFIDLPVGNDYTNFSSYKKEKVNYCSKLFKYLPIIKRP